MKLLLAHKVLRLGLIISQLSILTTLSAQDADYEWVEAAGVSSGSSNNEQTHDIAVDGNNNVYAIGNKGGAINFWNGGFVSSGHEGSTDVWITKLDEDQNFQWNTNIGGGGIDEGNSIDVDAAGNVYITGQFQQGFSGCEFGYGSTNGDPVFATLNPATGNNIGFVAKINTNGVWQWVKTFEEGTCFPASISVDPNGNVYTTGRFSGTVDFNPGAGTESLTNSGSSQDAFISKLDNNGNFIWTEQFSGGNFDDVIGRSITSDANFVYVKGYFEGTVEFELNTFGSTQLTGNTGALNGDYFIVKIQADGNDTRWGHLISRGSSTGYNLAGNTLALSDDGSKLYVTGETNNSGFVARLTNGNVSVAEDWLNTFGSTSKAEAIGLDNDDNVFITGYFSGAVDFDPSGGTSNLSAIGTNDAFITRLDANGNFDFAKQLGGAGADNRGYGIQIGTNGEIYSGGWFTATTDFDPNAGTENRTSEGARDLYIHKMFETTTVCTDEFETDTRTECEGYTWIDGNQYFSDNNTATHTVTDAVAPGCDSIYTLDLTIELNATGTDTRTECESYTWIDGNTYASDNNTATHTISGGAANGCDSIVTLDLTIENNATGTDTQTACESYTWIDGNTYTSDNNTATHTISGGAANGCDSIVTLDLTIENNATGTDTQTACESYTWIDGNTYTSDNNTATHTISGGAANGCDSIVTLDLTIENNATGTDTQTACGSYTWIDGNTYTSDNNTATHIISGGAANGCDSIVTLDLTIENNATGTDTQTACESYTWIDGNTYTSDNNTATHIISGGAANGCDSIVTLDLTVTSGGPSINIENVQNVSCANGDDGSAEAVVSGGASPYTYDWSPTGGTGATANNLSAGTYTVEVTDDAGCVGTENVTITAPDPINALASVTDANCGESNGSISLTTNGGTPSYSYSWSPGEDTNATLTNVPPGSYAVSITDDLGCTLDTVFNVALTGDFLIEALPKESTIQDGGTVGLSVNIDDNVDGENYTWTPPDGLSCTDCSSPDASPSSSTTYYVTVETTDGCSSTDSIHITIDDDCNELFIPNMFSPNGDGENDEFCIYGNCINSYQLSIYNRWGELIFNADDQNNCWDGTYNGKMMNTGVFAYKLFVTTEQGEEIEKSGNINLTR